jgi:hypothetical protein
MHRRYVHAFLILIIWLIPVQTILSHTSADGTILGRYTIEYFLPLVAYMIFPLAVLFVTFKKPGFYELFLPPVRWLRHHPILVISLIYALIEAWYAFRRVLIKTRFWGEPYSDETRTILLFLGLLEIYLVGLILFAGHDPKERKKVIRRAWLGGIVGGVVFVAYCLLYAYLIKPQYSPFHRLWWVMHQPSPTLGYTMRPNQVNETYPLKNENGQFTTYTTDRRGFRNQEDTIGAPLAVIGDSMIFGQGVSDEDVWANPLGDILGMPVANYGVLGYKLWQYNQTADEYLRNSDHRVVVYGIYGDDMTKFNLDDDRVRLTQRWLLRPFRTPIHFTVAHALNESPLYKLGANLMTSGEQTAQSKSDLPYGLSPTCVLRAAGGYDSDTLMVMFDEAIHLAEEIDYQLVVVTIPGRSSTYSEYLIPACGPEAERVVNQERKGYEFICLYLRDRGIPCYNMTGDMRQAAEDSSQLLYGRADDHFSVYGHQVFAELLSAYLEAQDLVPHLATGH